MIGYNVVKGLDWPVMWKGDPVLFRLFSAWMRALTSGRGLDTTARNLKLCVSHQMCDLPEGQIANQLLFAGYTSGSTLGSGCLLLAFMLLNCKASPWQLDKVKAFMKSIARMKVTLVVHSSAASRSADAWRTLGINLNHIKPSLYLHPSARNSLALGEAPRVLHRVRPGLRKAARHSLALGEAARVLHRGSAKRLGIL